MQFEKVRVKTYGKGSVVFVYASAFRLTENALRLEHGYGKRVKYETKFI